MTSWTSVSATAVLFAAALATSGCDDDAAKKAPKPAAEAAPTAPASASSAAADPAPIARDPVITLDDRGCTLDGASFTGAPAEWRDRLTAALTANPRVPGESIVVSVMRDTKATKVLALVSALASAKAKSVRVRTPTRDQTTGELELSFHPSLGSAAHGAPECSAVAMIEPNSSVAIWSKGGGGAQRFARGMAGPDLSSSTDALRKRAAACDSPVWFLGAADPVTWGLSFDLVMRARASGDGGGGGGDVAALKPKQTVLLTQTPVPGRAVKDE